MKKLILALIALLCADVTFAAYQYNAESVSGRNITSYAQSGYFSFDSTTAITMQTYGRDFSWTTTSGGSGSKGWSWGGWGGYDREDSSSTTTTTVNALPTLKDYGWYNLTTGEVGSFANGAVGVFNAGDKIGIWMDYEGDGIYTTTQNSGIEGAKFGYAYQGSEGYCVHRGSYWVNRDGSDNMTGRNTYEDKSHYEYQLTTVDIPPAPSGQPLPGALATLLIGGAALFGGKAASRKK